MKAWTLGLALGCVVSCGDPPPKNPWARPVPESTATDWAARCAGIDVAKVKGNSGGRPLSRTAFAEYQPGRPLPECTVTWSWNVQRFPEQFSVELSYPGDQTVISRDFYETPFASSHRARLTASLLEVAPPEHHDLLRQLAQDYRQEVERPPFVLRGGISIDTGRTSWSLSISYLP